MLSQKGWEQYTSRSLFVFFKDFLDGKKLFDNFLSAPSGPIVHVLMKLGFISSLTIKVDQSVLSQYWIESRKKKTQNH